MSTKYHLFFFFFFAQLFALSYLVQYDQKRVISMVKTNWCVTKKINNQTLALLKNIHIDIKLVLVSASLLFISKDRCHANFIHVVSVVDISSFFWFVYIPHMDIPYKTIFKSQKLPLKIVRGSCLI